MSNYKQIIIVRKDLNMSPGKMAAQVAHASMEFLRQDIIARSDKIYESGGVGSIKPFSSVNKQTVFYRSSLGMQKDFYEDWLSGVHAKTVLQAKNKNKLLKVYDYAKEVGLEIYEDFYPIYDNCYTELGPEENDGTTLTCIGFRPMKSEVIDQIAKNYHLYTIKGEK